MISTDHLFQPAKQWFHDEICIQLNGYPVITIITISTVMNKSPNGTSSSKKSVTDDLVKDYMYLSEPFSDFFSSSCFVSLQICVTSAQSCSKTLWCLWIRLRVFHLPSTSCCQRQTVPLPNRRQEFRHLSEGKIRF